MADRLAEIVEYILKNGFASAEELADVLNVAPITVRRDFASLEKKKLIRRVHGGATPPGGGLLTTHISWRRTQNEKAKQTVARYAASLVKPNESLFIDAGSTSSLVAQYLPEHQNITVITHSLDVVGTLAGREGIRLVCTGGDYDDRINAFVGPLAEGQLAPFSADRAFLGTAGLIPGEGSVNNTLEETGIKQIMNRRAEKSCILADGSKFSQKALYTTIPAHDVRTIITDKSAPAEALAAFRKAGVEVLIAE